MWAVQDLFEQKNKQARMSQKQGDQAAPKHFCDCVNSLDAERLPGKVTFLQPSCFSYFI